MPIREHDPAIANVDVDRRLLLTPRVLRFLDVGEVRVKEYVERELHPAQGAVRHGKSYVERGDVNRVLDVNVEGALGNAFGVDVLFIVGVAGASSAGSRNVGMNEGGVE